MQELKPDRRQTMQVIAADSKRARVSLSKTADALAHAAKLLALPGSSGLDRKAIDAMACAAKTIRHATRAMRRMEDAVHAAHPK